MKHKTDALPPNTIKEYIRKNKDFNSNIFSRSKSKKKRIKTRSQKEIKKPELKTHKQKEGIKERYKRKEDQ
jgi:hypothetical protein